MQLNFIMSNILSGIMAKITRIFLFIVRKMYEFIRLTHAKSVKNYLSNLLFLKIILMKKKTIILAF